MFDLHGGMQPCVFNPSGIPGLLQDFMVHQCYPLVNIRKAIENCKSMVALPSKKMCFFPWCSIVMLLYQKVPSKHCLGMYLSLEIISQTLCQTLPEKDTWSHRDGSSSLSPSKTAHSSGRNPQRSQAKLLQEELDGRMREAQGLALKAWTWEGMGFTLR